MKASERCVPNWHFVFGIDLGNPPERRNVILRSGRLRSLLPTEPALLQCFSYRRIGSGPIYFFAAVISASMVMEISSPIMPGP